MDVKDKNKEEEEEEEGREQKQDEKGKVTGMYVCAYCVN